MKRAAIERSRTMQVWRRHLATHSKPVACDCEFEVGRFRKGQRVGGCSTSRCLLCHFEKVTQLPKLRELRYLATFQEGVSESRGITRHSSRPPPAAEFCQGVTRDATQPHDPPTRIR